ncbi:MAG: anthranilate phosphoribosyltransferase [Nitrospirae bacterium]|nr:anthranilate phosphoribosyltransferase [Nitrospirota bacterium]
MNTTAIADFGRGVQRLIQGEDLSGEETYHMFKQVLENVQPDLQQGAFLAALAAKGETVDEIVGAWKAIDEIDTIHTNGDLPSGLFDNSGTGMDKLKTFNVSSASAIVAAACGVPMARHGARALTSKCGTVDMLESVGVDVECEVSVVENSIKEVGIGLFNGMSSNVHPGALGRILSQIRFGSTLNIAASLANPARPTLGLRGVYADSIMQSVVEVMQKIGYKKGMVVYGIDSDSGLGMDEISPCGETIIYEFSEDKVKNYSFVPENAGIKTFKFSEIAFSGSIKKESKKFLSVLSGNGHEACVDFVSLNAGAILYVAGKCDSIKDGVQLSRDAIKSGMAMNKLRQWVSVQSKRNTFGHKPLESLLKQE